MVAMRWRDRLQVIRQLLQWRLTWNRHDLDHRPSDLSDGRFVSARSAAEMIRDGATVLSCGLAANARCSIFYWAVRNRFESGGHPSGLTWLSVGAQGGRGRVPGTIEELALPGLITRYISGHVETAKALLQLADSGQLELHLMPQGEMTRLIAGQAEGRDRLLSRTGRYTFLDPSCGRGSPVRGGDNLIRPQGDELEFRLPAVEVALINAPYADRLGNIYFRHAATLTESLEAAAAARANRGKVLVAVADIIEPAPDEIAIPSDQVDAIVVNPRNEQTGGIPQRRYWPLFTAGSRGDSVAGVHQLRFANDVLGYTPARGPAEQAVARLGAAVFTETVRPGSVANLGVGYGEEVVRVLCEQGLHRDVTFTTETGVYGGVPAPGIYFGAAVHPQRLESSAWMFRHYLDHLDATILGFLEVDSEGNVNGAERGKRVTDLVGPGGLPSIVEAARSIIFIGGWMSGARWAIRNGRLELKSAGRPKFVERVRSITFSARAALEAGKLVRYVTHVGVFRLVPEGLLLEQVMPGISVEKDILAHGGARIQVPHRGVKPVDARVVTGREFMLQWPAAQAERSE
jgi:propionate CoA-transferase